MRALSILYMKVREQDEDDAFSLCWEGQGGNAEWNPVVPSEVSRSLLPLLLLLLLSRFSCVQLCATPQMAAHQAPPSRSLETVNSPRSSPRSCCSIRFSETVKREEMKNAQCFGVHSLMAEEFPFHFQNLQYRVEIRHGRRYFFHLYIDTNRGRWYLTIFPVFHRLLKLPFYYFLSSLLAFLLSSSPACTM